MKKDQTTIVKNVKLHTVLLPLMLVFILVASLPVQSQQVTLVALGNQEGVASEMKMSELKSIFLGEKQRWKDGSRVIIALMKTNTEVGKITCSKVYGMSGDELNKFWLALVFQGKAPAPNFFNSVGELETFVAHTPGAIGILDKPLSDPNIKSILIDGQKIF